MSFARSVQFTLRSGQIDEFNRLMNTEVLPLMKNQNGFRQDLTVLDVHRGRVYPEILKTLDLVLEGTPRVDTYDTILTAIQA